MMIRKAAEPDLDEFLALSRQFEEEQTTYGLIANTRENFYEYLGGYFYVVEADQRIVGYLYGRKHENNGLSVFQNDDFYYFELEEIYIHPGYRNLGYGTKLIEVLKKDLEQEGIKRLLVSSANKDWEKIYRFYLKNGFRSWTITMFI